MRAFLLALALSAAMVPQGVSVSAQSTKQRAIDPAKSTARFSIPHIFVERVTGTVPLSGGAMDLPADSVIPTKVTATLDAAKIDTGERDRDASLESPDYFDTARFPTWTFTSTKITIKGAAAFAMDGLLTIHGVTQPEHLDVTVATNAQDPVYHAIAHIDRHAFGMKGARLDPAIGNVADVTLDIVLK